MASRTSASLVGPAFRIVGTQFGGVVAKLVSSPLLVRDMVFGGNGRVAGLVTEAHTPSDTPVMRRVRLYRKKDGLLVREMWSSESGAYAFNNIDKTVDYYVIGFDHTGNFNAVIKDSIVPEAMP